ncbi:hypothetical protein GSY69_02155 [Brevibacterium sp. 5221]|uniref:Pyrimidine dimer DNA glycosylase n=1 Tax=Brevibacterium rongguiense TaxID=2695267 RepID=A0A6N9H4F7_9MICO|nr:MULTISPECIES: pyrimidine dimer DNA glycosylase/endonuclease V [Brevibacterium]MYM18813.1 hypothetical protein [Brevibacterium rongguiense]WAL39883.1 pyrimidine dimer DNA glycosylase/endonuclease V [Brevibacterium sp. BRM-1]
MRLWSLDPSLLDRRGLVACWREALLAQKVLRGLTRGYRSHPQLERFRAQADPVAAVGAFLTGLRAEADARGYAFDAARIAVPAAVPPPAGAAPVAPGPALGPWAGAMAVTRGQLDYERDRLAAKVSERDPEWFSGHLAHLGAAAPHPLFTAVPGPVEGWERQ